MPMYGQIYASDWGANIYVYNMLTFASSRERITEELLLLLWMDGFTRSLNGVPKHQVPDANSVQQT